MKKNTMKTLEEKLAVRADENAQKKIYTFKIAIDKALSDLFGKANTAVDSFGNYGFCEQSTNTLAIERAKLAALKLAISDHTTDSNGRNTKHHWPSLIWDTELATLRDELLAKMDLMQQLLMSKPRSSDDDVPCEGDDSLAY